MDMERQHRRESWDPLKVEPEEAGKPRPEPVGMDPLLSAQSLTMKLLERRNRTNLQPISSNNDTLQDAPKKSKTRKVSKPPKNISTQKNIPRIRKLV
jgi:hypothetical protein